MKYARYVFYFAIILIGATSFRVVSFLTISDLFFALSLLLWSILGFSGGLRKSLWRGPYPAAFGLVILGSALSLTRSADAPESLANIFKFAFTYAAFFLLAPSLTRKPDQYTAMLSAFCLSVVVTAAAVLDQLSTGGAFFGIGAQSGRMVGLSEHPNELGMHCSLGIISALMLIRISDRKSQRLLGFLTLAAAAIGVVASASITALAATVAGVLLLAVTEIRAGRFKIVAGILIVVLLVAGISLALVDTNSENFIANRVARQESSDLKDTTLGSRIFTYKLAFDSISHNPLVGVGSSPLDSVMKDGLAVHNVFLRGFVEGGILNFLGLLLFYFWALVICIKRLLRSDSDIGAPFCAALFVVLLVSASFAPITVRRIAWIPFALVSIPTANGFLRTRKQRVHS